MFAGSEAGSDALEGSLGGSLEGSSELGSAELGSLVGLGLLLALGSSGSEAGDGSLAPGSLAPLSAGSDAGSLEGSLEPGSLAPLSAGSEAGSLDGSLEGSVEPGSLDDGSLEGSLPMGSLEPGSVEGSLAPIGSLTASLAPLGSTVGSAVGSLPILLPVVLIGGSIAAAPMIGQSLMDLNIQLPELPGFPPLAGSAMPGPAPFQPVVEAPPAPGPVTPNGRGGEPGAQGGVAVTANAAIVTTGSLGDYEVGLPDGVTLPPLSFIR
ncbi:MAG: hypothetical protein V7768_01475 [Dietzia cercidiphylli]